MLVSMLLSCNSDMKRPLTRYEDRVTDPATRGESNYREPHSEPGPLARRALSLNRPTVHLGDPPGYRQAEAGAAVGPATSGVDPVETIEDARQVFRWDPGTGVGNH
jgi:hypothetical protein